MIKTLYIFDMGGVLAMNCEMITIIHKYLKITEEQFFIYADEDFRRLLEGKMRSYEFWKQFSLKSGQEIKEELFSKYFNPSINEETKDIIIQLKNHSRVVCGTNVIDAHYNYLLKRGDYDIFDKVYASHLIGISKPNPDFYRYILEKEGVNPKETIFVDDREENIIAAQNMGIKSILFKESAVLKELLIN